MDNRKTRKVDPSEALKTTGGHSTPFNEDSYVNLLRQTPEKNLNDKDKEFLRRKGY